MDELHNPPSVSTSDPMKKSNEKRKINKEELRKHLIKIGNEYEERLELGKMIYEMVGEGVVPVLPRHMKEQVDLYLKTSVESFPTDVELKPWQRKYIQPHDFRWVAGKVLIPTMISLVLVATMLSLNDGIWKLKVEKIGSKIMLNLCMEHEKW